MPTIDEDEPSPEELEALRGALALDPALHAELELILPALDPAARLTLRRAIARGGRRPAAAVLEALVAAAAASGSGRHPRGRD
jgi:hypothetical protein